MNKLWNSRCDGEKQVSSRECQESFRFFPRGLSVAARALRFSPEHLRIGPGRLDVCVELTDRSYKVCGLHVRISLFKY